MVEKRNNMNKLIDEAIDESIKFEKLMDQTDFDSWLEGDNSSDLEKLGQDPTPYIKFEENIKKLKGYCKGIITNESADKSPLEKQIVKKLFDAKIKRVKARICSKKEDGEEKYKEALYSLLSALNRLQIHKRNSIDKRWWILLYNDLSICYAGLENSSMSRGYAEEARMIIEDKSYKEFEQKLRPNNSSKIEVIANHEFATSMFYDLYTVTLFNQALAEKRSHSYYEAERNFRKIIEYAEYEKNKGAPLLNFNYYSTLLNLSDLYIDLSRGKEAIELLDRALDELDKEKEDDIRFWNSYLTKINALIDQSEYKKAKDLLFKEILETGSEFTLNKKHRITSTGFKGLNCFVRCIIDSARNELKRIDKEKECELNQVKKFILENKRIMEKRDPKGSVMKAYRQLSDIYKILSKDKDDNKYDRDIREYLIRFISEDKSHDLADFIEDSEKMVNWVEKCDDLDALESFTDQVIKVITGSSIDNYIELLEKLKVKITKECEDKNLLHQAEKISEKIDEVLEKKKAIELNTNIFLPENSGNSKNNLTKETIYKRLDINEMNFDSVLFKRSEMKGNHIAEVIILRRWNSFSPGLFKESAGSLGGGYLLRIKKYLFNFSDLAKENESFGLLNRLRTLHYYYLAKNMEDAKYSEEEEEISITKDNEKIATLNIKEEFCYLKRDNHDDLKIGVAKKEDNKLNIYSEDPHVENIVIDPGYNFLQNLRGEGFHVEDIDTIIVTHSHLDHCAELLPVMDLIYQFNKRYKDTPHKERQRKKVNLCLSKGAYKKISNYIDDQDWNKQLKDVIILENLKKGKCDLFDGLTISAIPTPHKDLGGAQSIGLKIDISIGKEKLCFGFTGDTPWSKKIKNKFLIRD